MDNSNAHFAMNPTVNIGRSSFDRNSRVLTSFNVGDIVPFYLDQDVLPGDTFQIETSKVIRMQTLLTPMMDDIYVDFSWWFIPNRLVWKHWREFCGENSESAWIPQTEYTIPQITSPADTGFEVGTIADYLGVPTGVPNLSMSALPFRAYALVMNEWFRSENLSDPLVVPDGDENVIGVNSSNYITDVCKGGKPYKAVKYKDYFTSCLPSPQKGPDVTIGLVDDVKWPVLPSNEYNLTPPSIGLQWRHLDGSDISYNTLGLSATSSSKIKGTQDISTDYTAQSPKILYPVNLFAYPQDVASVTINELRTAFQIQKFLEKDARGGTRYIELIKSHFGVTSPDARLQRPEFLGGSSIAINVNQVVQSSGTAETPQGTTAAFSLTTDRHGDFTRSFTEHGIILGLMVARYKHTYQQGLERGWSRKTRYDYYWPVFANLGEQAVKNKEIYAQSDSVIGSTGKAVNEEVFGYNEAWADYRYKPSHVTGEMRSQYAQSLDVWHLADDYGSLPILSSEWIMEDGQTVDRVLAVTSEVSNQLFGDIYIKNKTTRPMPVYSIPGLIDHH